MPYENAYIDFHCHPALKPFGHSFRKDPPGRQSGHRSHKTSLWRYDPPSVPDKLLNFIGGLTKFSQSNGQSLTRGGVTVICASLYPLERGFVNNGIRNELLRDLLLNFAVGIGDRRIDHLQQMTDYYEDLKLEYQFYRQRQGQVVNLPDGRYTYRLVAGYSEIEAFQEQAATGGIRTIAIVLSIEGLHVLNTGLGEDPLEEAVLLRLREIKAWEPPPFFITLAHHFWNHICGHAPSLSGMVSRHVDQAEGMGLGLTDLGRTVISEMLSRVHGPRILPDLKHMSARARQEFYRLRESGGFGDTEFPLLVSHGACNGLESYDNPVPSNRPNARRMNPLEINFYDDEIVRIARSGGLFALQLDERRIVSPDILKETKTSVHRHKIMHYRSELLWFQVQHVAETLDASGLFAWGCMAIGSDFDGIIDPLNGFWTAEELPFLADFLERHAFNYLKNARWNLPENHISADQVIRRIFSENGRVFLKNHFR